jgi:hypothetical protein
MEVSSHGIPPKKNGALHFVGEYFAICPHDHFGLSLTFAGDIEM